MCFRWILASLALAVGGQASANQDFIDAVRDEIVERNWSRNDAKTLAEAQQLSFALHDANGMLEARLDRLGRYAADSSLQELLARHPAWLDFFLALGAPDTFANALDAFSDDQYRREALLEAMLTNPGPNGLTQFEHVVITYGDVLGNLASVPEFGTLIDVLVQVGRKGATQDFTRWLRAVLEQADRDDVEALTVMLAGHSLFLRREIDIASRWKILAGARGRNPDLGDLLLGHLDIWYHLDGTRLIDVVNAQLSHFDRDKAQLVLVFLLGYEHSLGRVSAPKGWRKPLRWEFAEWTMNRLLDDPASPDIEAAFHFREDHRFWDFAMREGVAERMPCLLAKVGPRIDRLSKYFYYSVEQISAECGGLLPDWAPGGSLERLGRKVWYGTPIEKTEVGWAVLDVADVAITLITIGGGKLALPAMKGAVLAARGLRGAEAAATLARGEKVLASEVKTGILEMNTARRAASAWEPGLSRILNMTPAALATRASIAARKLPAPLQSAVDEMAKQTGWVGGDALVQNAMTTEFIRCAGIETLPERDPVCQALFPPAQESDSEADR